MADDRQQIIDEFDAVNMTPKELEDWLQTDESKSVGQSDGGRESKGHESGRRIVEIRRKNKSDHTDDDVEHMKRVNGYVKRHLGQGPKNDVEDSKWRYSLPSTFETQRTPALRFSVTLGREPEVEVALS